MHFWGHYIMNLLENMDHELWESKNVIYCYTNKINGKRYVGQTVQKLKNRHGQHLRNDQLIDKKIKQYGIENFKLEILHFADIYSIDMLEKHYIICLNTIVKNGKGYNVSSGGHNGSMWVGKTEEEINEIKKKIGLSSKGKMVKEKNPMSKKVVAVSLNNPNDILFYNCIVETEEDGFTKRCVYKCCIGDYKHHKGYKWYYEDDYKRLLDENGIQKNIEEIILSMDISGDKNHKAKTVIGVSIKNPNNILRYKCIKMVQKDGFYPTCVSNCCSKRYKSHKDYIWYYEEEYNQLIKENKLLEVVENINKSRSKKGINHVKAKSVVGVSTKNINNRLYYDYIKSAVKDGFGEHYISECCRKKRKVYKGYKWYYKEDYDKLSEDDIKLEIGLVSHITTSAPRSVVGVSLEDNNKKLFYDLIIQATEHGFDNSSISKCCNGKYSSHKGYKWYYKEDYDKMITETD